MKKTEINVLVVDDDATYRDSLAEAIKRFGFRPTAIAKADEALNAVKIKHFHAAIIDCMLPKQNGVEFSLDMRRTRFGNAPIILVSGVFRDKAFAVEAQAKTKAVGFLPKPTNMDELKKILEGLFKDLLSNENVPLNVLVSKPFSSPRERTKVIEGLSELKGFDLPFVLCVLMDAGASGHLNIAASDGDIFGVSLHQGKIVQVDSGETEATLHRILRGTGALSEADLAAVKAGQRGDLLSALIEEQIISPHQLPVIRKEQIFSDLRRVFVDAPVNINFVPERSKKTEAMGYDLEDLTPLLHEVIERTITEVYLKEFYSQWAEYPIQVGSTFKSDHPIFQLNILKQVPALAADIANHLTMEEILAKGTYNQGTFYKAIHLLAFRRLIIFDDVKKVKSIADYGDRMATVLKDLKSRDPFQVYEYFGAAQGAPVIDVERIYREFARSNHPDLLPPTAPVELRKIVNQVFSIVSEANTTLTNPKKRQDLINSMKQKEAEKQIRAEALAEEAINFLRRGRANEALERTREAYTLYQSKLVKLAHIWAIVKSSKAGGNVDEALQIFESVPSEERRTAQFAFVLGLLKKAMGDNVAAAAQFDKAIQMDGNFLEARREKSILGETTGKTELFNADLTKLVGNFFKKKS